MDYLRVLITFMRHTPVLEACNIQMICASAYGRFYFLFDWFSNSPDSIRDAEEA